MTNEDLIAEWKKGEARQRSLWQEILKRGLYFQASGIFLDKKDTAWRRPATATLESERDFYRNCRGHRRPARLAKTSLTQAEVDSYE